MSLSGLVFNVQRFSVHDGPGIRTTVFFKGCPLRCFWCHNPEGMHPKPEIQFFPDRCIACGECVAVCPEGAQALSDGQRTYRRDLCVMCGGCLSVCYAGALAAAGRTMTVEEVMAEVLRDRAFYETSGGGVTLSGGEPLLQRDFAQGILEACKAAGLHTAVETAAYCRWEDLAAILPFTDLIMMDLKHLDSAKHRAATGVPNEPILANARLLTTQTDKPLLFRIPVIPTVNDTPEEIAAIARFVRHLEELRRDGENSIALELLTFHRLATDKYRSLGMAYRAGALQPLQRTEMMALAEVAKACGVTLRGRFSGRGSA
jgi:pyruvate formate lyase activating enzyme